LQTLSGIVPRPLGEAIHGSIPGQVIHYDFCGIASVYVLIIRDDLSGFVHIRYTESANAKFVAEKLLEWIADFGIPAWQVSDQGSHFKNEVIREMNNSLQSNHHFTVAYSPKSNGSVEIIVKDFETTLKRLRLETGTPVKDWPSLLPMIQFALNHSPRKDKGNLSPFEIMTGRKPNSPLDACFRVSLENIRTKPMPVEKLMNYVQNLAVSMDNLHKKVADIMKSNRDRRRQKLNENIKPYKFGLGDYVLVAIPKQKIRSKLQVVWSGPQRITNVISDWVFEVENVQGGKKQIVHVNRLRFYSEVSPETEIPCSVLQTEQLFQVDELLKLRSGRRGWAILVSWLGFTDEDRTWEPVQNLYEDIPLILHDFLIKQGKEDIWSELRMSEKQAENNRRA
jgi:hypothetical protein